MNQVFRYTGYSKQSFHQKLDRLLHKRGQELLLLPLIEELRQEHPGVAARQLYRILKPQSIGRDRFEALCFEHGYKLPRKRLATRTTDSRGVIRFPNLLTGRELTDANQAWASDITYYRIAEEVYYLTFIIDLYTRQIVGFSVSKKLFTEQTSIPALNMAVQAFNPPVRMIFHSDGGGQYYCKEFLKITALREFSNSMCDMAYENPHAERINGTIKNQYLKGYAPFDFASLVKQTKRAIDNYNKVRPHRSLNNQSPSGYKNTLPAGGASLSDDNFCSTGNNAGQHQKNHHQPKRLYLNPVKQKRVQKTVNVI
jgi:transposase InsO family protein